MKSISKTSKQSNLLWHFLIRTSKQLSFKRSLPLCASVRCLPIAEKFAFSKALEKVSGCVTDMPPNIIIISLCCSEAFVRS